MKAEITNPRKETLPRYDAPVNADVPTVMVVADVSFVDDDGKVHHTQTYARLPEEFSVEEFNKQAASMQDDIDHKEANAVNSQRNALADKIIAGLEKK